MQGTARGYPYTYQMYDAAQLVGGWREGFERLMQDLQSGARSVDLAEFAASYGLPPGWTWYDVRDRIARSPDPENEFNLVLNRLYRAESAPH